MNRKLLLLDIDYTTFHESTPRPYLKEFIECMLLTHDIGFYTAANADRLMYVLRYLYHTMHLDDRIVRRIQRSSLSRERCPMVRDKDKGFEYKCLQQTGKVLYVDPSLIILLDDMPMHDNPNADQRIQVPGFWGQANDTYLRDLVIT